MRMTIIVSLLSIGLVGCETPQPQPIDREGKLLTLAAGEAQEIKDCKDRLTRQLNFAFRQIVRGKPDEARQSLAFSAKTLRESKPDELQPQIRIAGWVSISEMSRAIKDTTTAQIACDQAVNSLRSLQPIADRPDYVIGVADEVQALSGKVAAAKLLKESGDWIKQITPPEKRRVALVIVCDAIFSDDDYPGGLNVLRTDSDATWRSDTLAMLADGDRFTPHSVTQTDVDETAYRDANGNIVSRSRLSSRQLNWISSEGNAAVPGSVDNLSARRIPQSPDDERTPSTQPAFGKPVDFKSVFQLK